MEFSTFIYILALIYLVGSLIHRLPIDHWTIRIFVFPQLQFLALGLIILIIGFLQLDLKIWYQWLVIIIIIIVMTYQLSYILPYTIFFKKELERTSAPSNYDLKILISNVYQPNTEFEKVLELIDLEDPDIVFLVETNNKWQEQMEPLDEKYPYQLKEPLSNMYGLLFYSKRKLGSAKVRYIVEKDIPSVKVTLQLDNNKKMLFLGIHPEPPSPTENFRSTERDAELYLVAREIWKMGEEVPVIVAGDLNDVSWSKATRIFQKISKLLDPRVGRGFYNTFHADYPIRFPLDHFFVSHHFTLVDLKVHNSIGSDHLPVSLSLDYEKINNNEAIEKLEQEDNEEIREQINKAQQGGE